MSAEQYKKLVSHGILSQRRCTLCAATHHAINNPLHRTERFSGYIKEGNTVELYICKACYLSIPKENILIGTCIEAWQKEEHGKR